ncbi:hypothetical protein R75461_07281 [Paraburkholderia nemoris]|nr:hypothetical protein R75461_07281 [Paraburkholderia nemoris]
MTFIRSRLKKRSPMNRTCRADFGLSMLAWIGFLVVFELSILVLIGGGASAFADFRERQLTIDILAGVVGLSVSVVLLGESGHAFDRLVLVGGHAVRWFRCCQTLVVALNVIGISLYWGRIGALLEGLDRLLMYML